ncbi:MAG: tRNA (N(6)-L-threonylcarbamoyladenosine(37)-C(2))-methylthiotransferase MtaB [Candidatus Aminicenantes bacterium]|jgi:threonylcarbamoyladenosine tRNA methylthiotransferase MtaB
MTSFSIQTFGCRVNQAEAFWWTDALQKKGLRFEKDILQSDLIVINSCTLTSRADSDARRFIRRMSRLNPTAKLIVTGCYAERTPEELKRMPQVWQVFSNSEKKALIGEILSLASPTAGESTLAFRSRALVKVQDGCDFRCTFCIIPSVRGHSVSAGKREIFSRARELAAQGFKEIVLTGIHLSSYGLDLKPRSSLLELLREITDMEELSRIRLSSLDPRLLNPSLMEFITASEKICPHFHLSLQSGSDGILRRMGRKISVEDYRGMLSLLREKSPRASLGADIIVGFPEESDEDFEQTTHFLERSPLTYFHVFSYSPRPGTAAASLPQVNSRVKKERAALLRSMSREKNTDFRRLFLGKDCDAVVIRKGKTQYEVITSNYLSVRVPSSSQVEKEEVKVRITEVDERGTKGQIVNQ